MKEKDSYDLTDKDGNFLGCLANVNKSANLCLTKGGTDDVIQLGFTEDGLGIRIANSNIEACLTCVNRQLVLGVRELNTDPPVINSFVMSSLQTQIKQSHPDGTTSSTTLEESLKHHI